MAKAVLTDALLSGVEAGFALMCAGPFGGAPAATSQGVPGWHRAEMPQSEVCQVGALSARMTAMVPLVRASLCFPRCFERRNWPIGLKT